VGCDRVNSAEMRLGHKDSGLGPLLGRFGYKKIISTIQTSFKEKTILNPNQI
jgi:hypothetical protein